VAAALVFDPFENLGVLVSGIVVDDHMHLFLLGHPGIDDVEEATPDGDGATQVGQGAVEYGYWIVEGDSVWLVDEDGVKRSGLKGAVRPNPPRR
jgi:hypothetical protein